MLLFKNKTKLLDWFFVQLTFVSDHAPEATCLPMFTEILHLAFVPKTRRRAVVIFMVLPSVAARNENMRGKKC